MLLRVTAFRPGLCLAAQAHYNSQRCLASLSPKSDFILQLCCSLVRSLLLPDGKFKNILGRRLEIWSLSHNWKVIAVNSTVLFFLVCFYHFFPYWELFPLPFYLWEIRTQCMMCTALSNGGKENNGKWQDICLKLELSNLSWEWTSSSHPTFKWFHFSKQKASHALKYAKYISWTFRIEFLSIACTMVM